ncbi:MAG: hypothetical protein BA863_06585 [Desulfovibrio sp. S3730MH75]|nr:MAG: hypothetical protein BA863_06585 [Desulfovibrio sp. S3730MH75]
MRAGKSGFALIATLWVMTVLGVMAASLAFEAQCESKAGAWSVKSRRTYNLARAGVHITAGLVREHALDKTHSLHDKWFSNPARYRQVKFDKGYYSILRHDSDLSLDKSAHSDLFNEETRNPRYGLDDEESRLNINVLDFYQLCRLPEVSEILAADIILYVTEQKDALKKINYRRRDEGLPEIKDAPELVTLPVRRIAELLKVKGMTKEMLFGTKGMPGGLAQYLTCYSTGKVNINTASPEVFRAIGFNEQQVRFFSEYRWGKTDGFASVDEALSMIGINDGYLNNMLSASSRNFRINCVAGFSPDKPEERIRARLTVGKNNMRFTMWESEAVAAKSPQEI